MNGLTTEELDRLEELAKAADKPTPSMGDRMARRIAYSDALRNAAPALIAAARALNKACEDREKAEKWWSNLHGICIDGRNKLAAENAKLRAVVEAARKLVSDGEDIEVLAAALSALGAKGVE